MVHSAHVSVVPFAIEHVGAAADLVVLGVERLRARLPVLPQTGADPAVVARVLTGLVDRGAGLAVVDDGRLIAFQAATIIDGHGGRWSYTPDLGHAAPWDDEGRLRETLYTGLADGWVRGACLEHVVTVLAGDEVAQATLARLGFGHVVVDLVRGLDPVDVTELPPGVTTRRALPADAGAIAALDASLRRHLGASPVFLRQGAAPALEVYRRGIADPTAAIFVAERDGAVVAFLRIGPPATDVAGIVRDAGTASITRAFTVPGLRAKGIASSLLADAVAWARENGYARCAVDHESANREGARFWARHATPAARSMMRRLAPGMAG